MLNDQTGVQYLMHINYQLTHAIATYDPLAELKLMYLRQLVRVGLAEQQWLYLVTS